MSETEKGKQPYRPCEAFCLMTYQCKSCSTTERIWNSRDGVTPFIVRCARCGGEMQHVNWGGDIYDSNYIPGHGERVFIDLPASLRRPLAARRLELTKGTRYEVPLQDRERIIGQIVVGLDPGEPFLVTL